MKDYKTEAIVINTRDLGESDKILTLYTRERGKVSAVSRGVRKPRARLAAVAQVFTYATFQIFPGRQLHRIAQVALIDSFHHLRQDLDRLAYASYFAELVDKLVESDEPHEDLFILLLAAMHLVAHTTDLEIVQRWFELKLMSLLGYHPHVDNCIVCQRDFAASARLSVNLGGVLCHRCVAADQTALPLTRSAVRVMRELLRLEAREVPGFVCDDGARADLRRVMRAYVDYRLSWPLKSLAFLESLPNLY